MKKLLLLFIVLLTGVCGYAQTHQGTKTGTNTLNAATIKSKAAAGTLLVSIQNHTTYANNYINKEGKAAGSFDTENATTTWEVVPYNSAYALKNCDGKYIYEATRPMTLTDNIANALLFMPTDCEAGVANIGAGYNSSQAVRWKLASNAGTQMNTNGMSDSQTVLFNTGTGNWTCLFTYEVSWQYEMTFSCKVGETLIYTESGYYDDGSTPSVPDLPGYTASPTSVTVAGADASHDVAYTVSSYPVNFPRTQSFTRSDRHINSVTFNSAANSPVVNGIYENTSTHCYQDLTASKTVNLFPNTSITPSFSMTGVYQHGFVYIDLNNDGDFTDEGELVSMKNEGNPNLSTEMPAFTSPSAKGTYRMRIKTDWASTDPAGNTGADPHKIGSSNHIISNGGMIVDVTLVISEDYTDMLTDITKPFTDYPAETGYFRMTSDNATSFLGMIDTAKSDDIIDADEYAALLEYFKGFVRFPNTGYYLIKNSDSDNYLAYGTPGEAGKAVGLITTEGDITPANIIRLMKVGFNEYTISSQGLNVQARAGANNTFPMSSSDGVVFSFVPQNATSLKITNTDSYVSSTNPGTLFEAHWTKPYAVVNWEPSGTQGQWTVEAASTVTIPLSYVSSAGASFSTLYLPFGATIEGADAYIITARNGEWAIATQIDAVPANTGVLLRAEGNVPSATVRINDEASAETTGNLLNGTNVDITADRSAGEYILGNGSEGLGFYQRKSGRKIGANKAYLDLGADIANVKGLLLSFDELVDGIGLTPAPSLSKRGEEVIFNLSGQRMSRVQKGVNIVNGKKVLVK